MNVKATLEFTWPEDKEELRYAVHGVDAIMGLKHLEDMLRQHFKHGNTNDASDVLAQVQKEVWSILADCGEE